jgi:hypothetical protein
LRALRMADANAGAPQGAPPGAPQMPAPSAQISTAADAPPLPVPPDPGGTLGLDPSAKGAGAPDSPDLPVPGDPLGSDTPGDPGLTMPQPAPLDIVPATVPIDPDALPE